MRRTLSIWLLLLAAFGNVHGNPDENAPVLRPLPLVEGVRDVLNRKGDLAALKKTDEYRRAKHVGLDLADYDGDPVVAHGMRDGTLFYVFYKKIERAYARRVWVVQRIKRTERNWRKGVDEPETKVTYQVEAFKLFSGEQKRGDQHHGGYGIKDFVRREIVKEYEIGFADIPGLAEGDPWPWKKSTLFEYIARYGRSDEVYRKVSFHRSVTWSLTVTLDAAGNYRVLAPELGIDVPVKRTDPARTLPEPLTVGASLVLVRGVGLEGTRADEGWFDDYVERAGKVLQEERFASGHSNTILAAGLMANRRKDGSLNTLQTRAGFAGRTKEGIAVGSPRWAVLKAYGQPKDAKVGAAWWHYGDIGFWFDGLDRVGRFYVRAKR